MDTPIPDRAWKLLEPEGAWTQKAYARSLNGSALASSVDPTACSWCTIGALGKVYPFDMTPYSKSWLRVRMKEVAAWNDAPERTQAEVVALLKSLDI